MPVHQLAHALTASPDKRVFYTSQPLQPPMEILEITYSFTTNDWPYFLTRYFKGGQLINSILTDRWGYPVEDAALLEEVTNFIRASVPVHQLAHALTASPDKRVFYTSQPPTATDGTAQH